MSLKQKDPVGAAAATGAYQKLACAVDQEWVAKADQGCSCRRSCKTSDGECWHIALNLHRFIRPVYGDHGDVCGLRRKMCWISAILTSVSLGDRSELLGPTMTHHMSEMHSKL
jgi:hypothetical protein